MTKADEAVYQIADNVVMCLLDSGWSIDHAMDLISSALGNTDCDYRAIMDKLMREYSKEVFLTEAETRDLLEFLAEDTEDRYA